MTFRRPAQRISLRRDMALRAHSAIGEIVGHTTWNILLQTAPQAIIASRMPPLFHTHFRSRLAVTQPVQPFEHKPRFHTSGLPYDVESTRSLFSHRNQNERASLCADDLTLPATDPLPLCSYSLHDVGTRLANITPDTFGLQCSYSALAI